MTYYGRDATYRRIIGQPGTYNVYSLTGEGVGTVFREGRRWIGYPAGGNGFACASGPDRRGVAALLLAGVYAPRSKRCTSSWGWARCIMLRGHVGYCRDTGDVDGGFLWQRGKGYAGKTLIRDPFKRKG